MTKIHNRIPRAGSEGEQNLEAQHVAVPGHAAGEIADVESRVVDEVACCGRGGRGDVCAWFNRREGGLAVVVVVCVLRWELGCAGLGYCGCGSE